MHNPVTEKVDLVSEITRYRYVRIGGLVLLTLLMLTIGVSGCGRLDTGPTGTYSNAQRNATAVPFAVSSLPTPSDLHATLTCPNGKSVPMSIDFNSGMATGTCTDVAAGNKKTISIDFTYGNDILELAHASKTVDVASGKNLDISFTTKEYDESFDDDQDGSTNLYEVVNGMNPRSATITIEAPFAVSTLPSPADLHATLTCPDGTNVIMAIDTGQGMASGDCTEVTAGNNLNITVDFTYGNDNLELATASQTITAKQNQNVSLSFSATDYIESFDADNDGSTNLYEIANGMNPVSASVAVVARFTVSTLPIPSNLHAAVTCPDGSSVNMAINFNLEVATADCTEVTTGNNLTVTVNFNYGSDKLALARVSKLIDLVTGQTENLSFTVADYDVTSLDDDRDGYPNYYELINNLYPDQATAATIKTLSLNMLTARKGHTATRLPDGTVLLAGGSPDGVTVLADAAIFDPTTNTYAALVKTMTIPRMDHTATLLPDGTVLLAGGHSSITGMPVKSAEIYDPKFKSFTALTATMISSREGHSATRLPDGLVLLAGGKYGSSVLSSAERYDPSSKIFSSLSATLNTARTEHTASLLPDGNVLLAGGTDAKGEVLASAEIYDSVDNTFTTLDNNLHVARTNHSAARLPNGEVLLAGGTGGDKGMSLDSLEIFDSRDNSFSLLGLKLPAVLNAFAMARLPDGQLLISGGTGDGSTVSKSMMSYQFPTETIKEWTWVGGSNTNGATGVYGTKGVADAANVPGAMGYETSWSDGYGNLWLFGGIRNDVWRYDPNTSQWTWVSGSNTGQVAGVYGSRGVPDAANIPGSRWDEISWSDAYGNLWLFGGNDASLAPGAVPGDFNDLWRFDTKTNQWTWMSGSNTIFAQSVHGAKGVADPAYVPGSRDSGISWTDTYGNLWLFGGITVPTPTAGSFVYFNELWRYNPNTNQWAWMGESAANYGGGVYGTKGVADAANWPAARYGGISWTDTLGNLWLFGGFGYNSDYEGSLNDLWRYDTNTSQWTWMSGSDTFDDAGVYGTQGVADAANVPSARLDGASWTDARGNLWLLGGFFLDVNGGAHHSFNDLWRYDPKINQWTWMGGSNTGEAAGVYGTKGVADVNTTPGARSGATSWIDTSGQLWLFGGSGYDENGDSGSLNDLWRFQP